MMPAALELRRVGGDHASCILGCDSPFDGLERDAEHGLRRGSVLPLEDGDHSSKKSVVCDRHRLARKMVHERIREVSRGHFSVLHQQLLGLRDPALPHPHGQVGRG